jgi:hypothetical protein
LTFRTGVGNHVLFFRQPPPNRHFYVLHFMFYTLCKRFRSLSQRSSFTSNINFLGVYKVSLFSLCPKFVLRTNQGSKAILVLKNEVFLNQGLFRRNKRYRQGHERDKLRKRSFASFSKVYAKHKPGFPFRGKLTRQVSSERSLSRKPKPGLWFA